MDLIKTGIGIGKTIKNVSRFREILSVFAKNGLEVFIVKMGFQDKIPDFVLPKSIERSLAESPEGDDWWSALGYRLRKSAEELGPSFIKLGQLMSTREDLFHPNLIQELKYLQNRVNFDGIDNIHKVVESSLGGRKISDIFSEFDLKPMATASIAAVYRAKLVTGENVVVKVRKPNIAKTIATDFQIVKQIVSQLEKMSSDAKRLGASKIIEDFFASIKNELNFVVEAKNAERLKNNLKAIDKDNLFVVPKVYPEFSSDQVLTMEMLDGRAFNEIKSVSELASDFPDKIQKCIAQFVHTLLVDGFFHADLHGGNFFYLKTGQIGLIDFGLMGTLSRRNRENLVAILYFLFNGNFENLVYEFLDVAEYDTVPNPDELIRDIRNTLEPYLGLSVQQTNMSELVRGLMRTLASHGLYLPREWFIIFRALITIDGTGKSLGLDINVYDLLEDDLAGIMKELASTKNLTDDLVWVSRDVVGSLRLLPRHLKWFLKEISKNNYALDLRLHIDEKDLSKFIKIIYFLAIVILSSVFVLCGVFYTRDGVIHFSDIPWISWAFWGIAAILLAKAHYEIRK